MANHWRTDALLLIPPLPAILQMKSPHRRVRAASVLLETVLRRCFSSDVRVGQLVEQALECRIITMNGCDPEIAIKDLMFALKARNVVMHPKPTDTYGEANEDEDDRERQPYFTKKMLYRASDYLTDAVRDVADHLAPELYTHIVRRTAPPSLTLKDLCSLLDTKLWDLLSAEGARDAAQKARNADESIAYSRKRQVRAEQKIAELKAQTEQELPELKARAKQELGKSPVNLVLAFVMLFLLLLFPLKWWQADSAYEAEYRAMATYLVVKDQAERAIRQAFFVYEYEHKQPPIKPVTRSDLYSRYSTMHMGTHVYGEMVRHREPCSAALTGRPERAPNEELRCLRLDFESMPGWGNAEAREELTQRYRKLKEAALQWVTRLRS